MPTTIGTIQIPREETIARQADALEALQDSLPTDTNVAREADALEALQESLPTDTNISRQADALEALQVSLPTNTNIAREADALEALQESLPTDTNVSRQADALEALQESLPTDTNVAREADALEGIETITTNINTAFGTLNTNMPTNTTVVREATALEGIEDTMPTATTQTRIAAAIETLGTEATLSDISDTLEQMLNMMNGTVQTITLYADEWADNTQIVEVPGVSLTNNIFTCPIPAHCRIYQDDKVYASLQDVNALTFECSRVPTVDLNIMIFIVGN